MKQLIIDKDNPNGKIVEIEQEQIVIPYEERIVARIRAVYSIDDEIAILRQKDTKPEEFAEYNAFVEQIKAEEKGEL
jgi:hypothetical protein